MEMLSEDVLRTRPDPEGTMVFDLPAGNAKVPLVHLDDYGKYVCWVFDHPERSTGLGLGVATKDTAWKDLAPAFADVTGQKAVYKDVFFDEYFVSGALPRAELLRVRPPCSLSDRTSLDSGILERPSYVMESMPCWMRYLQNESSQ